MLGNSSKNTMIGLVLISLLLCLSQGRVVKAPPCTTCGPCSASKPLIIIGAGVSGLSTAFHLKKAGCTNVLILEARDHIGGRMVTETRSFTDPKTGHTFDYVLHKGANWVHGINNPIWDMNQELGLFTTQWLPRTYINVPTFGNKIEKFAGNETYVPGENLRKQYEAYVLRAEHFTDWLQSVIDGRYDIPDLPYSYYLQEYMAAMNLTGSAKDEFLMFVDIYATSMAGDDLFRLGLTNELGADRGMDKENMVGWPGYNTLNHYLAQGLKIELGQEVTTVEWVPADGTNPSSVRILTAGGSVYEGSAVLVTIALGAMKHHTITFSPDLPNWKWHAVDDIGIALLDHVYLLWNESWWPNADALWKYKPEESNMGKDTASEWYNIHNLLQGTSDNSTMPPLLLSLPAGLFAKVVETMTDDQVQEVFLGELKSLFPDIDIPPPAELVRTQWYKDRFTFGAYSSPEVGTDPLSFEYLAQDIGGVLFFAGEATSSDRFGYVDGAFISGQREAQKILTSCCGGAMFDGSPDPKNSFLPSNHKEIRKAWTVKTINNLKAKLPGFVPKST
eukprot:c9208_g1_i1.p1 GENE.c9208_g1_i1~~c9208_g1_i1.p1  ORF type:complete len:561 (+),score=127.70 c9208_g1_i1:113-1795(+)